MSDLKKLVCSKVISYRPIGSEPDPNKFTEFSQPLIVIPPDRRQDPFKRAKEAKQSMNFTDDVCVLIPGTEFDANGTRHGKGGGWYDRFLSHIPRNWKRVGICNKKQFSENELKRETWDEPVDWILIVDNNDFELIKAK